ncbi:MAG: AmmeMemoRadiSam system protein B [Elusimicrobiota bacterium]
MKIHSLFNKYFHLPSSIFRLVLASIFLLPSSVLPAVRQAAVAGQFYPDNPNELSAMVQNYLDQVPAIALDGEPVAVMVPHAGYIFSAKTAAYAFKLIEQTGAENVILIGNSHRFYLSKGAVVSEGKFKTPLGEVEINSELARKILANTALLEENAQAHAPEHSLEVELPFLQKTLKKFRIVPILLSEMPVSRCEAIGKAIGKAVAELGISKKTIIVASSDMSHYPRYKDAKISDNRILESVKKFDPAVLAATDAAIKRDNISELQCTLCGLESVCAAMYAARYLGATSVKVLNYTNSGDASGDTSRVVGYGSVVFYRPGKIIKTAVKEVKAMDEFKVSEKGQKALLKIARESIESYLKTKKLPSFDVTDKELLAPGAVFVTLTEKGGLRGCIGTTVAQSPLYQAVSQLAVAAAVEDTRFPEVTAGELKDIHIEISVLSPLTRIKNADEILPNKHGVVVRKGFRSGLFLPQVWEHFNKKEDFMDELCWQKAGLDRNAWKTSEVELYIFTVFAFEESK